MGSIPARAGEPHGQRKRKNPERVYPRACGGTYTPAITLQATGGLSPRVRGNRLEGHAGDQHTMTVYPRACGGTMRHR